MSVALTILALLVACAAGVAVGVWLYRSRYSPVMLMDLIEMENRMALKVSELKTEVAALKTQVTKIWDEQQKKYDALKAAFDNVEIDADAETALAEFKQLLTQFDDTIPDTQA